jgi:RNA-directed DNA polymerase
MSKMIKVTNCVRGVLSPLLANIFLHVVFDKWMEKDHPGKPFERYADDIVVHCKSEVQAVYVLKMIQHRMTSCKLTLHPVKTKIINLRGTSEKKYPKSFDFLGFTIRPLWSKISNGKLMVSNFMSTKSKTRVLEKFKSFHIHKWRKSIEEIALKLKPVIQGVINYYCKFWTGHTHWVWYQLNQRLLKWVRWEKGLYEKAAIKWLKQKYKATPRLFPHWQLVHP